MQKKEEETNQENVNKIKTEMCKNWQKGKCNFGKKCAFAHGFEELRAKVVSKNFRTKDCKNYSQFGYCKYGERCQFRHRDRTPDTEPHSPISRVGAF